jgi:hypothetical protein
MVRAARMVKVMFFMMIAPKHPLNTAGHWG